MIYVIMCGGVYEKFQTPKHLSVVKGERVVDRTIRLLKENGIKDIYISATDPRFNSCDAPRLIHQNTYKQENGQQYGYWLDAFYPFKDLNTKVCYIFGDVYFSEEAIKTIVNYKCNNNTLFGTSIAKNKEHKNWGEPFAYIVNDYKAFKNGIEAVKKMQDDGKTIRMPVVWELYRYLNNFDVNIQQINDDTFVCIDDGTIDIDDPKQIEKLNVR